MAHRVILTLAAALLILPQLGARTLWQDEAETALIARVILERALPFALDQQGPINNDWSYQFAVSPLWRWHPWLQFYLTAASFKLLGPSAFSARLPFALVGIATVWLYLSFLTRHGPKKPLFFWTAAVLLLLSAPFLLHLRQARYFALSALFTLLTVDGYLTLTTKVGKLQYLAGSILLFHSFLPGALATQASLWFHHLTNRFGGGKSHVAPAFPPLFALTLPLTLPWAIWLKVGATNLNLTPELLVQHLQQHYIYLHKFIFPFFLGLAFLSAALRRGFFRRPELPLFAIIIATHLTLYAFTHPYFFRYLVPLIPLFGYLAAWLLTVSPPVFRFIIILALVQMTSRTLPGYLTELITPYHGTNEKLVAFFNHPAQTELRSLATNYDEFTFRFHTDLVVYGPQHLIDAEPFREFRLHTCPDVVIVYPQWGNEATLTQLAADCQLAPTPLSIPYAKLADDPSPVTHRFNPPIDDQVLVFTRP